MWVPSREPPLAIGAEIDCQLRQKCSAFIGELAVENARTRFTFPRPGLDGIIMWKDDFAEEQDPGKMQDKHSYEQKKCRPVGHEYLTTLSHDLLDKVFAGHALESFAIFRGRLLDDLRGNRGAGRRFVPIERLEIIAHELFVEAGRALPDDVLIRRPETRGIRRETFVDQEQFAADRSEFEFRVGDDDAAVRRRVRGRRNKFAG